MEGKPISPNNPNQTENQWGRPLKFKSVKELQNKIDAYFNSCFIQKKWNRKKIKPFTILWLCNYLDIDRKTLINYEDKNDEFFHTIKRAKSRVEEDIELWALTNTLNPTSAIFNLKNNFWWVDKTESDVNVKWKLEVETSAIDKLNQIVG